MKRFIRKWLGIDEILTSQEYTRNVMATDNDYVCRQMYSMQNQLGAIASGLGRIIAKLDPIYGQSENPKDNPERKAESDRTADEVIAKLKAEDWARKHSLGEVE
jgi:hypothetical protein